MNLERSPLRKKCPYSDDFWSVFIRITTGYGDLLCKSPYSIQIRENMDQKNSEYGHFVRSGYHETRKVSKKCFFLVVIIKFN